MPAWQCHAGEHTTLQASELTSRALLWVALLVCEGSGCLVLAFFSIFQHFWRFSVHCDKCGLWCKSVRHHQLHECIVTKTRIYIWVQEVCQILISEGVQAGRITPTWGGGFGYKGSNRWT